MGEVGRVVAEAWRCRSGRSGAQRRWSGLPGEAQHGPGPGGPRRGVAPGNRAGRGKAGRGVGEEDDVSLLGAEERGSIPFTQSPTHSQSPQPNRPPPTPARADGVGRGVRDDVGHVIGWVVDGTVEGQGPVCQGEQRVEGPRVGRHSPIGWRAAHVAGVGGTRPNVHGDDLDARVPACAHRVAHIVHRRGKGSIDPCAFAKHVGHGRGKVAGSKGGCDDRFDDIGLGSVGVQVVGPGNRGQDAGHGGVNVGRPHVQAGVAVGELGRVARQKLSKGSRDSGHGVNRTKAGQKGRTNAGQMQERPGPHCRGWGGAGRGGAPPREARPRLEGPSARPPLLPPCPLPPPPPSALTSDNRSLIRSSTTVGSLTPQVVEPTPVTVCTYAVVASIEPTPKAVRVATDAPPLMPP